MHFHDDWQLKSFTEGESFTDRAGAIKSLQAPSLNAKVLHADIHPGIANRLFFSPYLNKVREHKTDIVFYSFFRQPLFESDLFRLICFFGYQTSIHSPNSFNCRKHA
ncbi:hypothetical protein [Bacillus paralicheniformis]|uniref:hypothetical protein n=1 Tax=Bacillus paralicheniformis TaxID=1648923 RepID=UPI0006531FAE|nr:hypothetical protein [Bacillus paralicheniformis]ARA84878.1 hypothetical protein BLMD_05235 [Bacillus paralicheniformis]KRT89793.1 hypothetical protein ACH97_204395 [Bacillus paralicheniformis]MEC1870036.1 hypothetical protein [Bacillus paralicheniformis]